MSDQSTNLYQQYRQVKNPFPKFIVPKKNGDGQDKATLPFNRKLMDKAAGLTSRFDFSLHVAFARSIGKRFRKPPVLRVRAIEALLQAMCFHYDPLSNRVNATLTTLAIECGLATESSKGNLAITRCTRALQSLADDFGLITYSEPMFDPQIGCHIPTDITLTTAFFDALDISAEAVKAARRSRAEWKNSQREKKGLARLEIADLVSQAWQGFHQRFKEYRLKRKVQGEKRAQAKRDAERSHAEVTNSVRLQITREISRGTFPADRQAVLDEVKRRVKERMIISRGNYSRLAVLPVLPV
ncbi:plasmid replication initiator RepA [Rouxiella badensis]|uniref:plasmid replication initiator RepA n=1 Tax=Rouxiella badensis TaxID=1646377 RepID=UPI001787CF7F|nr:plasmid replication initiator RepA [Rouxiella badensis]QOI57992.1 incFII family plasmid replication initiator RepA [Rouxiella badensis subsp. acadiensis]